MTHGESNGTPGGAGGEDESELDLEHAILLDELAAEFLAAKQGDPSVTPETFASRHPEAGPDLLAVLRGMGALHRVTPDDGPLRHGQSVGPYRVRDVLGRGGMGIVYEAAEVELGRIVALKAMDAGKAGSKFRARFLREGRAAARLDHPNIVPVLGAGEDGDILWYAMRRIDGESLDQLVKALSSGAGLRGDSNGDDPKGGGPTGGASRADGGMGSPAQVAARRAEEARGLLMSSGDRSRSALIQRGSPHERAAVRVAFQISEALGYAHSCGILHRDVKPGNVLLDRSGNALLTDFGLCKVSGDESLTAADDIVGTLRYLAPESLRGQTDERADVYGVGLILYELVCLKPAFESGTKRALIDQILHAEPVPVPVACPGTDGDLGRIIAKAVAKLPEERYQSAALLAKDLSAFLEGRPVEARPPSALYLARLFVRRNKALAATAFAALLAVAVSTTFYVTQLRSAFQSASEARDEAVESRADALVATAEAVLRAGDIHGAASILEDVPAEHRGWMWRHLSTRAGKGRIVGEFHSGKPIHLSSVQDGEYLLESGWDGAALRRAADLELVGQLSMPSLGAIPVNGGTECIHLTRLRWDLSRVKWTDNLTPEVTKLRKLGGQPYAIHVTPDESEVLVLDYGRELYAVSSADGTETWRRPMIDASVLVPTGGRCFVAGLLDGRVLTGDDDPERDQEIYRHQGQVTALMVEDGLPMASASKEGDLILYPAITGGPTILVTFDGTVHGFCRTTIPHLVAVLLGSNTTAVVDVRSGHVARVWTGMETEPRSTVVVGGKTLTVLDNSVIVEHTAEDHDGRIGLPTGVGGASELAIRSATHDAPTVIAAQTNLQSLRIYNLGTGIVRDIPMGVGPGTVAPSFSPDGRLVASGALVVDIDSGEVLLGGLELDLDIHSSVWGPNGELYLGALRRVKGERGVRIWRWREGESFPTMISDDNVDIGSMQVRLLMHPSGSTIYAVDGRSCISAWSLNDLEHLWVTEYPGALLQTPIVHAAAGTIVLACADGIVRSFSLETGEEFTDRQMKVAPKGSFERAIASIVFGPEPGMLTTCNREGSVEIWDLASGDRLGNLAASGSEFRTIAFDPASGWMAAGGVGGSVVLMGSGESPVIAREFTGDIGPKRLLQIAEGSLLTGEPGQRAVLTARALVRSLGRQAKFPNVDELAPLMDRIGSRLGELASGD